jgi:GTPase SAR1 family protein
MDNVSEAVKIREKYKHFRILVIGRANAGKTTLLKRVCNTTDDPCIYDEESKDLVLFQVILESPIPR